MSYRTYKTYRTYKAYIARRQFADALREGDVNVISTRRFFLWPATVVFGASGFEAPIPFA